jgi:hypothetical protein
MADRDSYVKTGVDVDDASFDRLINRYKAAIKTVGDMRSQLGSLDSTAKRTGDTQVNANKKVIDTLYEEFKAYEKVQLAQKKVAEGAAKIRSPAPGAANSGGGIGGAIGGVESLASRSGAALRGLGLGDAGGIVSSSADILQLANSLGQLGPIAAGAIAGIAIALPEFNRTLDASGKTLKSASERIDAYYNAVLRNTTDSTQAQIKALQDQKKAVDANLKDRLAAESKAFASEQGGFGGDAAARLKFALAGLNEDFRTTTGRTQELKKESASLDAQLQGLNTALTSGVLAANDAAEAEKKLTEARVKGFQDQLAREKQFTDSITQEEKDAQVSTLQAQIDFNKKWLEKNAERIAGDENLAATFDKVEEETKKLTRDLEALKNAMPSSVDRDLGADDFDRGNELQGELIDLRKQETEWILKAGQAMNEFGEAAERIADERALSKFREQQDFDIKRARDSAGFARKQAADDAKYYKDRAKSIASFQAEQAKSDNEASKARIKAIADANDAQIKAAEDFAKTVRGFTEQINEAGANLDAVGVRNAQRGLKDATDEYNREKKGRDADAKRRLDEIAENAQAERDQRAADFATQLADAAEQHREQREADAAEFRERQRIEDEDRRLRLQRQQEDYRRQDDARRAAFDRQIQNLRNQLLEPEEDAKEASYSRQRRALNDFLNGAVNDINAAKAKTSATTTNSGPVFNKGVTTVSRASPSTSPSSFDRSFASGGFPPLNKAVRVGELGPETVVFKDPAQVFRAGANTGGAQYNFNGNISVGGSPAPAEFYQMARTAFEGILKEAFPG